MKKYEHTQDRNFDGLAEHFKKKIYGSSKGEIRLRLLWDDLEDNLLNKIENAASLAVLDVGGGIGQISAMLAKQGHTVTVTDVSKDMLELANEHFVEESVPTENFQLKHLALDQLSQEFDYSFDLVMFHAVLEWLADPKSGLLCTMDRVAEGGYLSLMFYNKHSVIMKNLLKGNFRKVVSNDFIGERGGLTPISPLDPLEVYSWLESAGFEIVSKTGIRVVNDYLSRDLQANRSYEDILHMEKMLCRQEPYLSLGRYIHVVARKQP
ncbi:methyltransferase [Alkalimarinus sediminis]|uniref:tRNA 5-carboxymethoxyuridine methyltransferase n=1 Tax=Alkalimarinus sediminis TaxID=1632866 RepID=A0A9E8HLK7_9ALTE|nr:methyltransferase [Alkalimarinus sediminis]UZW76555.1 methyltransferase domain-containing protein [Alkalimarinus sediminis]